MKYLILIFTCLALFDLNAQIIPLDTKFINIIGKIESNNNDSAVGDNGKSISRYQIQYAYYLDAKEYNPNIKFSYQSLTNKNNALIVMESYLNRYGKQAIKDKNYKFLARLHNGGPNGNAKPATLPYWKKFQKELAKY